jgi:hypothetical protein
MSITEHELAQCQRANQTGRQPVVFVHGLWLLPSSWDRWAALFEDQGYVALTPGWPDDPDTVAEATAHPEVFAGKSIGQVADHFATPSGGHGQPESLDRGQGRTQNQPFCDGSCGVNAGHSGGTPGPGAGSRIRLPAGAVADGHSLGVADSGGGPRALLAERGRLNQPALPGERTRSAGAG